MNTQTNAYGDFAELSDLISLNEFEQIKSFVLKKGDRQTYRNIDNNNPHFKFKNFHVYLGSDIGQKNLNNDPALSDFNQLVIYDHDALINYYEVIMVRKGDVKIQKSWLQAGMQESHLYLLVSRNNEMEKMLSNLSSYLEQIRNEVKID
jgi:hypothetical protein